MRRITLPAALAALAALAVLPAHAGQLEARYEVPHDLRFLTFQFPDFVGVAPDGSIDVGAVRFDLGIETVTSVTAHVRDDVNPAGRVFIVVCQDLDHSTWCHDERDIDAAGCVAGDGSGAGVTLDGIAWSEPVFVRVFAVWGCPEFLVPDIINPAIATQGTVTLSYAQ